MHCDLPHVTRKHSILRLNFAAYGQPIVLCSHRPEGCCDVISGGGQPLVGKVELTPPAHHPRGLGVVQEGATVEADVRTNQNGNVGRCLPPTGAVAANRDVHGGSQGDWKGNGR